MADADAQALVKAAAGIGAVLLVAAAGGKILGTTLPARLYSPWPEATALGVSMVPRAEITMLIMHRASSYGPTAAPSEAYAGMVFVSAVTCLAVPPVLGRLLRERNRDGPL